MPATPPQADEINLGDLEVVEHFSMTPGTYYALPANVAFSFNPIAFAPGVTVVTGAIAPGLFNMPGSTFWAGILFDNNGGATGATAAQLDMMGQGVFDPPTAGSSGDVFFHTAAAGSFPPGRRPVDLARGHQQGVPLHIYVDADACPVKPEVFRVAGRYDIAVTLVAASWMRLDAGSRVRLEVVEGGFDAADDWIAARVAPGDLVITADIPLAARCIAAGAQVLAPTGRAFTESNIGDVLATRNLLAELRGAGMETGGPAPFDARDRSRFLQALDQAIQAGRPRS